MLIFCRRLVLTLSLLALAPLLGAAGAFEELAASPYLLPLPQFAAPAAAEDRASAPSGHYLSLDGLDLTGVPAAPADGSAQDREDFKVLFDWQARRTAAQCTAAKAEMDHSYEVFFARMDSFGDPTPAPVAVFFKNVAKDSVAAHRYLKDVYQRQRPFVRDERVKPCIPRVSGLSYPSGHAAMSRLFALILSDLEPSRRKEYMARADQAALNRVIGGVHHPSDIEAGKALADELYKNLLKQSSFKTDLKALRPFLN